MRTEPSAAKRLEARERKRHSANPDGVGAWIDKFAQLFTSSEPEPEVKPKVSKSRGKYTERAGRYDELSV